jgi:hypothetical protein
MLRVFTLMLASFPKLIMLFCLYRCPPLMCYTLVLSLLLIGVGFGLSLISFWGCLRLILHALNCFIRSFEPFKTRSCMLFANPVIELLEIPWMNQHGSFFSCYHGVCVIFEEVVRVNKKVFTRLRKFMTGNWYSL